MEDVLLLIVFLAYFRLSIHSFIFASAVILILYIFWKCLKKQKKLRCIPVNLSSDALHDILTFLNRQSLSRLRSVGSLFNQTIQRGFANKPYLLLERLYYWDVTCRSITFANGKYCNGRVDRKMLHQILAAKFVRFLSAYILCCDQSNLTQVMSMRHQLQTCNFHLSAEFKLTKFHARRLSKCKEFDSFAFCGKVTFLPELFMGNCRKLEVSDDMFTTADSASVPWIKMLDFLFVFRPGGTYEKRCVIRIGTSMDHPSETELVRFVHSVIQRFTAATSRLYFEFEWRSNAAPFTINNEHIWNDRAKQYLHFEQNYLDKYSYSYFTLRA